MAENMKDPTQDAANPRESFWNEVVVASWPEAMIVAMVGLGYLIHWSLYGTI